MFLTKSIVYTALLAVVRADNTAAIAAGSGLKCVVPSIDPPNDWEDLEDIISYVPAGETAPSTVEECYAYAKNYVMEQAAVEG